MHDLTVDLAVDTPSGRTGLRPGSGRSRRPGRALMAALALCACTLSTQAQVSSLEDSTVRAVSMGATQRSQIEAYVARHAEGLTSENRSRVVAARDALSDPLTDARVSVAFRQAYSSLLSENIGQLAGSAETWRRLVGLRLAADIATQETIRVIEAAMASDEPEIRYFSQFATETVFDAVATSAPAVTDRALLDLVRRLGETISTTDDARLADAAVRALQSAMNIPESRVAGVRTGAVTTLARSAAELARRTEAIGADDVVALPLVRAGLAVRDYVAVAGSEVPASAATEAVGLGGDLIAFVFQRVERDPSEAGKNRVNIQLAGIGSSLAYFGDQRRAAASRSPAVLEVIDLVAPLRNGDLATFRARALRLIGEAGYLRSSPYNMPGDRFSRG